MALAPSQLPNSVNFATAALSQLVIGCDDTNAAESKKLTIDALRTKILEGVGSGVTNLSATASPSTVVITSDTGTDATIIPATGTNSGLLTPAQFDKLAFITVSGAVNLTTLASASHAAATAANASMLVTGQALNVRISATVGNQLTLNGDGLYVASPGSNSADRLLGIHDMGNQTGAVAINLDAGTSRNKKINATGNITLSITGGATIGDFTLIINPNNFTITWPGNVTFEGGSAPTLTGTIYRGVKMFYVGT